MFDSGEVSIIYDNVGKIKKKFNIVVVEIKLNPKKIKNLINQLKKGASYFKKIGRKNIIYLGFVNCENKNSNINFKPKLEDVDCIIYGIKDSKLCSRNLKRSHDWVSVSKIKKMEERLDKMEERMDKIEKRLDKIEERIEVIEAKLDNIINLIKKKYKEKKEKKLTGKKRKRRISKKEEKEDESQDDDNSKNDFHDDESSYNEYNEANDDESSDEEYNESNDDESAEY